MHTHTQRYTDTQTPQTPQNLLHVPILLHPLLLLAQIPGFGNPPDAQNTIMR